MIYRVVRGRKGRSVVGILFTAYAIDLLVAPWIIANVTIPLLNEMVRLNPQLQGIVNQALSLVP